MDGLAKFVLGELDMINRQYARDHGITIRSKDDEDDFDPICGGCGAELTEDPPDAEFCGNCLLLRVIEQRQRNLTKERDK